jgi:hypothetical protein
MSLLSEISTLTARTAVFIQIHSCSFAKFAASFFDLRLSAKICGNKVGTESFMEMFLPLEECHPLVGTVTVGKHHAN